MGLGFVTRGRGVSVHRKGCQTFARMAAQAPERVLETGWGEPSYRNTNLSGLTNDMYPFVRSELRAHDPNASGPNDG